VTKDVSKPLEDELGDVIEKALRQVGMSAEELARQADVPLGKILDAIDYRPDLSTSEIDKIAAVLGLNEVGLSALGIGRYPLPEIGVLPFCVWPLAMPHGIGVANAYLVGECGSSRAILFDTGANIESLHAAWPKQITKIDAVFLTHVEAEHAGGLCQVVAHYGVPRAYVPANSNAPCGFEVEDGTKLTFGPLEITSFATPGHAAAHNCYFVRAPKVANGVALLVAGDLVFAGSTGAAHYSAPKLQASIRRMMAVLPPDTAIAPGHGPMTTVGNEMRYNPFCR